MRPVTPLLILALRVESAEGALRSGVAVPDLPDLLADLAREARAASEACDGPRRALDNCRALATQNAVREGRGRPARPDSWQTILRFCREGGSAGSVIRGADLEPGACPGS
ncbi:hypothetical protein [Deinococcus xianganensis]|uniref:hypothetical protein n=1 Tax=Deinococcus xianganensis TaxID=1507289 RepID=UPI001F1D538E|nr:hypothetical protein [Deinococcus xianganensis]